VKAENKKAGVQTPASLLLSASLDRSSACGHVFAYPTGGITGGKRRREHQNGKDRDNTFL
jgi:hypothetical protein